MFESTGELVGSRWTAGETVVVFSDGVSEALNPHGEEFGEELPLPLLASRPRPAAHPRRGDEGVRPRLPGKRAPERRDVTMLVVRYRG
ncbi:MAG: hypothetical protein U0Q12_03465 [Vicinamibacterales bacterium]